MTETPHLITTQDALEAFCRDIAGAPYVSIDTEFLRDSTFWPKLCLVQAATPQHAAAIDPLADGIDLAPLLDILADEATVKVFHAARQDIEIFVRLMGAPPRPVFDTQIAAMVCGFGEQVGYETLVRKIARASVDKSSRFTDWSRRPLSDAQKVYALADVTHLRKVYEFLAAELKRSNRTRWVEEELETLTNPATYDISPDDAWLRLKTRTNSPRFLAIVRELAAFRESYAQTNNVPRNRVFKDDALMELASAKPANLADLGGLRLLLREARRGPIADGIVEAVARGQACPQDKLPKLDKSREKLQVNPALADLLRVLLKSKTEAEGVAAKLIASSADLDAIAAGERNVPALSGWRHEVFGADALRLCEGKIALAAKGQTVRTVEL